jgi:hypothetical protein
VGGNRMLAIAILTIDMEIHHRYIAADVTAICPASSSHQTIFIVFSRLVGETHSSGQGRNHGQAISPAVPCK